MTFSILNHRIKRVITLSTKFQDLHLLKSFWKSNHYDIAHNIWVISYVKYYHDLIWNVSFSDCSFISCEFCSRSLVNWAFWMLSSWSNFCWSTLIRLLVDASIHWTIPLHMEFVATARPPAPAATSAEDISRYFVLKRIRISKLKYVSNKYAIQYELLKANVLLVGYHSLIGSSIQDWGIVIDHSHCSFLPKRMFQSWKRL